MNRQPTIATTVLGFPVRTSGPSYLSRRVQAIQLLAQWRSSDPDATDLWLRVEISCAFQQMLALGLPGHPAAEMLPIAAEMWIQTIGYNLTAEADRERVKAGFRTLFRSLKQWPQPADLLAAMPGRASGVQTSTTVAPRQTDEDHAAATARFQEFMDGLGKANSNED